MPRETDAADFLANEGSPEADRHLAENFGMTVRQVRDFDPQTLDATRACKFLGLPPKRFDQLAAQPEARAKWVESVARQKKDLIETFPQAGTELKGMLEAIRKFSLRKCLKPDGPALVDGGGLRAKDSKSRLESERRQKLRMQLVFGGIAVAVLVLVGGIAAVLMTSKRGPEQQAKSPAADAKQALVTPSPAADEDAKQVLITPKTEPSVAPTKPSIVSPVLPTVKPESLTPPQYTPFKLDSVWVGDKRALIVTECKDDAFTATFKIGSKLDRIVTGIVKNGKIGWLAKDVNMVVGDNKGSNYDGTLTRDMDGDKIIFEYNASNDSKVTFTLRLINGPVEPFKKNSDGLVITSIDFTKSKPGTFPFANSKFKDDTKPELPSNCIVHCWKASSVAEFRVEKIGGSTGMGIANLNDAISAQILVPNLGKLVADKVYRARVEYLSAKDTTGKIGVRFVGGQYPTLNELELPDTDGRWKTATLDFIQPAGFPIDLQIYNSTVGEGKRITVRRIDILETQTVGVRLVPAPPRLDDLTGAWDSDFGKVTLETTKSGVVSGSWIQGINKKGIITGGTFTPGTRTLTFFIAQPWNNQKGSATFTLSADGTKLDGTWKHSSGNGEWQMTRVAR